MRVVENGEMTETYFCINTPGRETNPILILAQVLREQGMGILISDRAYGKGGRLPDQVAILTTPKAKSSLDRISTDTRIAKLCAAENPTLTEPDLGQCDWDSATERKVEAFYWQRKALGYGQLADMLFKQSPLFAIRLDVKEIAAHARADILLGGSEPLDIRSLIAEIVEQSKAESILN